MKVVEVRDSNALRDLQEPWQDLESRCKNRFPYLTWEWCEAWWRRFGDGRQPCVLMFEDPDAPSGPVVGIAPLFLGRAGRVPLRQLAWIGTPESDYTGLLAAPGFEESVASSFLSHLRSRLHGWDVADLKELRADAPLGSLTDRPWPDRPAATQLMLPMQPCPYVRLPRTWEELRTRLGPNTRRIAVRYERMLLKAFPEAVFSIAESGEVAASMDAFFRLHQESWETFRDPALRAFHMDVAERFGQRGWLRLHLLEFQGGVQGALYCFCMGGRTFHYLSARSVEFSKYRIGAMLVSRAVRRAVEEGCSEFDFQRGGEDYKYHWASGERVNRRLLLVRPREGLAGLGELAGRTWILLDAIRRSLHQDESSSSENAEIGPRQR